MKKVTISVPKSHFEKFGITFPADWDAKFLNPKCTEDELIEACAGVDYLFTTSDFTVSRRVVENTTLKMIHTEGVGFNRIDCEATKEKGIFVCNNRAVNNIAVAEHTIGLILAAQRRTALVDRQIHEIGYGACKAEYLAVGEHELYGKTLGLIGIGAIGREVAKRANAFGCNVIYYDAFPLKPEQEKELNVKQVTLDDLIKQSDIISLHVPVLDSTLHMINAERLSQMKKSAILVNTARGAIIDQQALCDALENGIIAAAALDVVDPDEAPADLNIFHLSEEGRKRLTLTPHVGGMTDEAFERMLVNAIANFERCENGERPVNIVNGV